MTTTTKELVRGTYGKNDGEKVVSAGVIVVLIGDGLIGINVQMYRYVQGYSIVELVWDSMGDVGCWVSDEVESEIVVCLAPKPAFIYDCVTDLP